MAKYRANASEPFKTLKIKALDSMPIGSIIQFAGTTIPTGWLECDGSTITQNAYPELYNLIGGTLPDYRGRVLVGQDTNDTDFDTIGKTGGSKTDNLSNAYAKVGRSSSDYNALQYTQTTGSGSFNRKFTASGNVISGGSDSITDATALGGSVSRVQPYAVVKHIIKAKNTTPTMGSIVNNYSTSTKDGYSCDYLNWKLAGSTTSNGYIAIPSSAIELHIMTRENDQMYTKSIMVSDLVNGDYFYDGFYVSSTNYGVCAWQYDSTNGIHCLLLQRQGASKISESTTKIYYK